MSGTWTCANDVDTNSGGTVSSLAQGAGITLSSNPITTTGTIAIDPAYVQRRVSASCAVGSSIRAIAADGTVTCETDTGAANAFVQGGNAFGTTATLGTTDNTQLHLIVNDSAVMRYFPHTISPKVIGGSAANEVWVAARGATIGGGGTTSGSDPDLIGSRNIVTDAYGTVGGGTFNQAGDGAGTALDAPYATVAGGAANEAGDAATVGGGVGNRATGVLSTVAGGTVNHAVEYGSAVGGGDSNYAIGQSAVVPGGESNRAEGAYSVAMGYRAKALGRGSFSFADSNDFDFSSASVNVFRVRATGGVRFVTDIDAAGAAVWSCLATAGSGWACSSDAPQKQNLERLDGRDVLERLASLPVYAWNPKDRNAHVRHFGPTAQDFHATFKVGDDDTLIGTQDADGVALAAIQGLHAVVKERDATIARQEELLRAVQSELDELRAAVRHLLDRSVPR